MGLRWPLFIILILFGPLSHGAVGVGGYVSNIGLYQKDASGGNNATDFRPLILVNGRFKFFGSQFLRPEFGLITSRTVSSISSTQKESTLLGLVNLSWEIFGPVFFNYGLGTFWSRVESESGDIVLRNGSSTSTFYTPSGSSTSVNSTLNLGLEVGFDGLTFSFMTYTFQIFNSQKRSISYSLSLNYFLGKN